ncbi:MAG: hypothetical protein RR922_04570 [Clostridia bacterium]
MKKIYNCISCLNCKIEHLEEQLNCVMCVLSKYTNENVHVGYGPPIFGSGEDKDIYIQLDGGIFYANHDNTWDNIGALEPLIVDGGSSSLEEE